MIIHSPDDYLYSSARGNKNTAKKETLKQTTLTRKPPGRAAASKAKGKMVDTVSSFSAIEMGESCRAFRSLLAMKTIN